MSLKNKKYKFQYRSNEPNEMVSKFYIPALNEAVVYKRAAGFFSSTSLVKIAKGLSGLIRNNGKMQLIISQVISEEDALAIEKGYKNREEIIEETFLIELEEEKTFFEKERLNYLAHLISENRLDVKIAIIEDNILGAIYHEKIGIIKDSEENVLAFTGSLNESNFAYTYNFESIDVYCSWSNDIDKQRALQKENDFNCMWNNDTNKLLIYEFPQAVKDKILMYKKKDILNEEELMNKFPRYSIEDDLYAVNLPKWFEPREYQLEAVKNWSDNNFIGLMNMATGTGKTLTALLGVRELYSKLKNDGLLVVIVCPYIHLVEQWRNDVVEFNIKPILAFSNSKDKDWKSKLSSQIIDLELKIRSITCVITTNSTYETQKFQEELKKRVRNILLIVDEAHNAGAYNFSKCLLEKISYRLALSATPDRYLDEEGTSKIYKYFEKEVYNFSLERAIKEGYLTRYFYFPQIVYLNNNERQEYKEITKKLSKFIRNDGMFEKNDTVEMLLIKRSRIIAGADNKIYRLRELMLDKVDSNYNLIYCAATSKNKQGTSGERKERQIDSVCKLLGNELNMKIAKFTSEEGLNARNDIIERFSGGNLLQCIVAIKCLDEGVNIPAIKNAYILASSSNPREFIQRRGRVLRKYEGKEFAFIYDFITLPREAGEIYEATDEDLRYDLGIIKKELLRAKEFASLAENKNASLITIDEVLKNYDNILI